MLGEGGGGALPIFSQYFQSRRNEVLNGGETEGGMEEEVVDVGFEEGVLEEGSSVCSLVWIFDEADGEKVVEVLGPLGSLT